MAATPAHRLLGIYFGSGAGTLAPGCVSIGFNITMNTAPSGSDAALGNVTLDTRGFKCEGTIVTENLDALNQLVKTDVTAGVLIGETQMIVKYSSSGTARKWTFLKVRLFGLTGIKAPWAGSDEPISRATVKFTALFGIATTVPGTPDLLAEAFA